MIDLKFSYNWNHKLDCNAFTTIRLYNSQKHIPGQEVNILLNEKSIGTGAIKDVVLFQLDKLNSFTSFLDTGYSVEETKKIFYKMYPKVNFSITQLALILIVKNPVEQRKAVQQKELFN
jgi:hypothetical protein